MSTIATPLQGLLGGVGLALSVSVLLFASGRTFGVSGFMNRAFDVRSAWAGGWTHLNGRLGDILAVLGIVLGGMVVAALEHQYTPDAPPSRSMIGLDIVKVATGGFLVGAGSKVSNHLSLGCTVKFIISL